MFRISTTRRARNQESGYILIAIIFAVTLLIITLATSLPAIRSQIQRDREDELIHRGNQYERAIQLYYRKFGRYPNSIDDLVNTNNLRFLRKRYTDPITGKDEWRLIHFGEAQAKPLPPYMSRQGGAGGGGGAPASGISGVSGNQAGSVGSGATNASDMSSRVSGTTYGGGPLVGIASTSDKEGLKEVNGKTKYSDWEFVYDPTLDPSRVGLSNNQGNNGTGNNNLNGPGNNNNNPTPRPPSPGGR